jgi:hypothetical protein
LILHSHEVGVDFTILIDLVNGYVFNVQHQGIPWDEVFSGIPKTR